MLKKYPVKVKDDPLKFMVVHHQFLFNHKIFTPLFYISFGLAAVVTISASIYFINTEGVNNYLIHHSLEFFLGTYILSNLIIECMYLGSTSSEKIGLEWYWDVETASPSSKNKINETIRKTFRIYALATTIIIIIALSNFLMEIFTETHYQCDIDFIAKWFAGYQNLKFLLTFLLSSTHVPITLTTISLYLAMKYSMTTMKIQLDLLVDFLNQIELYDSTEDLKIKEHLRICTVHHIAITKFLRFVQEHADLPILFLPLTGLLAVLGCLIYIYYNNSIILSVFLMLPLFLEALLVVDICTSCQDIEDAFDQFFSNLLNLKWYQWSESNKKSLLVMMTRSHKSAAIEAFNVQVNRGLIIRFARSVYQIFLIIKQTM